MRTAKLNAPELLVLVEDRGLNGLRLTALVSEELGRRIDCGTIYKILRGERQPGPEMFKAICDCLKATKAERAQLLTRRQPVAS